MSRNSPSGESIQGGYLGAEEGKPIRRCKVTTIKVEIEEQKGGMAISMEMGGSEDSSQSEMMIAIVVRSKIEEALNSITLGEELEKIEKALCKEGKE